MIDVHSHIIPKIDDGSKSFEESYKMIEKAQNAGFTDIIATSHYIEEYYEVDFIKRHSVVEAMNKIIKQKELNIKIHTRKRNFCFAKYCKINKRKESNNIGR